MSNSLIRKIAVTRVTSYDPSRKDEDGTFQFLMDLIEKLGAKPVTIQLHPDETLNLNDYDSIDGIVIADDVMNLGSSKELVRLINDFHSQTKPIAAIGYGVQLVASIFGRESLEVAVQNTAVDDQSLGLTARVRQTGAIATLCSSSNHISDRDHKILTSSATEEELKFDGPARLGVTKMMRELIEMA